MMRGKRAPCREHQPQREKDEDRGDERTWVASAKSSTSVSSQNIGKPWLAKAATRVDLPGLDQLQRMLSNTCGLQAKRDRAPGGA